MNLNNVVISNNRNHGFIRAAFHLSKHKFIFFLLIHMGYTWPWRCSLTLVYHRDLSFSIKVFSTISAGHNLSLFLLQFLLWQIWHLSREHTVWQLHGVESVTSWYLVGLALCFGCMPNWELLATMMDPFGLQQKLWLRKKGSERQIISPWNKPSVWDLRYLYEGW